MSRVLLILSAVLTSELLRCSTLGAGWSNLRSSSQLQKLMNSTRMRRPSPSPIRTHTASMIRWDHIGCQWRRKNSAVVGQSPYHKHIEGHRATTLPYLIQTGRKEYLQCSLCHLCRTVAHAALLYRGVTRVLVRVAVPLHRHQPPISAGSIIRWMRTPTDWLHPALRATRAAPHEDARRVSPLSSVLMLL